MPDYAILDLRAGNEHFQPATLLESLWQGDGRFGWGDVETADLYSLRDRIARSGHGSLSPDEQACYQSFPLEIKKDDYAV